MSWRKSKSSRGSSEPNSDFSYGFRRQWQPYIPVAERRRQAQHKVEALAKKGLETNPVVLDGRAIAKTFWGKAWCDHLEIYADLFNRLPKGRTYVRNGAVIDLKIEPGQIKAIISGTSAYYVKITILPLERQRWHSLIANSLGQIGSLVELLEGRLSTSVMETVTSPKYGLFPEPPEITMKCSCPDVAKMCKHVAAALYGVGSRLDNQPELLFLLRQVDQAELISQVTAKASIPLFLPSAASSALHGNDLSSLFGIDIAELNIEAAPVAPSAVDTDEPRLVATTAVGHGTKLFDAVRPEAAGFLAAQSERKSMPRDAEGRGRRIYITSPTPALSLSAQPPLPVPTYGNAPKKRGRPVGAKNKAKPAAFGPDGLLLPAKRLGRPPGAKTKEVLLPTLDANGQPLPPRQRGRPKGSKNKRLSIDLSRISLAGLETPLSVPEQQSIVPAYVAPRPITEPKKMLLKPAQPAAKMAKATKPKTAKSQVIASLIRRGMSGGSITKKKREARAAVKALTKKAKKAKARR